MNLVKQNRQLAFLLRVGATFSLNRYKLGDTIAPNPKSMARLSEDEKQQFISEVQSESFTIDSKLPVRLEWEEDISSFRVKRAQPATP